jgi:hypothetical protein
MYKFASILVSIFSEKVHTANHYLRRVLSSGIKRHVVNRRFEGTCHRHIQGLRIAKQEAEALLVPASRCFILSYFSILKVEATNALPKRRLSLNALQGDIPQKRGCNITIAVRTSNSATTNSFCNSSSSFTI